ncbi:MAG: hypothetical protein ACM3X0_07355 [Bacteroidota bacterium]
MMTDLIAGNPGWRAAFQRAFADPQVVELAGRLKVDLADENKRDSLLLQAEDRLKTMSSLTSLFPLAGPAMPGGMPHYRVSEALRAYREIGLL